MCVRMSRNGIYVTYDWSAARTRTPVASLRRFAQIFVQVRHQPARKICQIGAAGYVAEVWAVMKTKEKHTYAYTVIGSKIYIQTLSVL